MSHDVSTPDDDLIDGMLEAPECPEDDSVEIVKAGGKVLSLEPGRASAPTNNRPFPEMKPAIHGRDEEQNSEEGVTGRRNSVTTEDLRQGKNRSVVAQEDKRAMLLVSAQSALHNKMIEIDEVVGIWEAYKTAPAVTTARSAVYKAYTRACAVIDERGVSPSDDDIEIINSCNVPTVDEIRASLPLLPVKASEEAAHFGGFDEPEDTNPGVKFAPTPKPVAVAPVSDSSKTVVPGSVLAKPNEITPVKPVATPAPAVETAPSKDPYTDLLEATKGIPSREPSSPKKAPIQVTATPSYFKKLGLAAAAVTALAASGVATVYGVSKTNETLASASVATMDVVDKTPAPTPAPKVAPAEKPAESALTATAKPVESTPAASDTVVYGAVRAAFSADTTPQKELKIAATNNALVEGLYADAKNWQEVKAIHPWSTSMEALIDLEGKLGTWGGYSAVLESMDQCAPANIDEALACVAKDANLPHSGVVARELAQQITAIKDTTINPNEAGVAAVQAGLAQGLEIKVAEVKKNPPAAPKPFVYPSTSADSSTVDADLGALYDAPEPMGAKQAALKEALAQEAVSVAANQAAPRYEDRFDTVEPAHFASKEFVVPTVGNAYDTVEPQHVKPVAPAAAPAAKSVWGDAAADKFFAKGDTMSAEAKAPVAQPKVQEAPKAASWTDRFSNVAKSVTSSVADVRSKVSSWFGR